MLFRSTAGAARTAPLAILLGVGVTEVLGLIYSIAASFATTSVDSILQTNLALPMGQVYLNTFGKKGALALWWLIAVVQACLYHCLNSVRTSDTCSFI